MGAVGVGGVNHITLTVSNINRSKAFYTEVLNFQVAVELTPERLILSNDQVLLAISTPWNQAGVIPTNDVFNENRVGLDHLSFNVPDLQALQQAVKAFDERGVPHGEIKDLSEAGLPMYVLAFRDPDNIQLELTAPK